MILSWFSGTDYTFSTTDDSINITATLAIGDTIVIKDYADTTGSYIPPTPTKLGMYPKFKPESFTDNTYTTSQTVIRRHDGSIIKAYGDERDDLILELEKESTTTARQHMTARCWTYTMSYQVRSNQRITPSQR
jgi:hypothetical protein